MSENSSPTSGEEALAALRDRLQELYRRRGRPSYRELARLTGQALSHTTVGMVIHCRKLPRLGQLELVVEALDGDPEAYQALWLAADEADSAAAGTSAPARLGGPYRPTGTAFPHTEAIGGVAFHPDGRLLATRTEGRNATVRLWDVATGEPVGDPLTARNGWVHELAFHPDGHLLAAAGDAALRLWDVTTGEPVGAPLTLHSAGHRTVAFHPGGRLIAVGGGDDTVRLWDVTTGRPAGDVRTGHRHPVFAIRSLTFHPEGRLLATAGNDATVRLFDVITGEPVGGPLVGHKSEVTGVVFHPDGHLLVSTGNDATVRLWDVMTGEPVCSPLMGHIGFVSEPAFHPDGRLLATAGLEDGDVRLWDVSAHRPVGEPFSHSGAVRALAFHPDGHLLATGGNDATLRLWRGESTPEPHLSRRRADRLRARLTAVREDRDRLAREVAALGAAPGAERDGPSRQVQRGGGR
ncbi:WD40 repeat domain-containing protein [Microbispora sp. H10670]|uniref:WD40 repeat domain-containing protein n=1 Tax=Microbispora sp. H10670 TaxID=2729108 RepID=UPI001603D96D|nr:WD40 repeat domain-containing protein [Microbispora sp. H10670]